jgi:hypothetical protein
MTGTSAVSQHNLIQAREGKPGMNSVARITISSLLLMLLAGCAGNGSRSSTVEPTVPASPAVDSFGLPAPDAVQNAKINRTSATLLLERNGSEYDAGFAQRVNIEEASVRLNPAWTGGTSAFEDLAYGIYSFNVEGYTGVPALKLSWGEAPLDYSKLWIGFSRWGRDIWDWYAGPASGMLELSATGYAPYTKPGSGEMLVAVVLLGTAPALLDKLQVGDGARGDWWMMGHDPQHTFRSNSHGPAAQPHMLWECDLGAGVTSNPVSTNTGVIYVTTSDSVLHAVSPSGAVLWSTQINGEAGLASTPAIGADGTVYVGGRYYLNALWPDGTWRWSMPAPFSNSYSPAISPDEKIYITAITDEASMLYCYNANGELQWDLPSVGNNSAQSPAIAPDGSIYAGFIHFREYGQDEYIYRLSPTGEEHWHTMLTAQCESPYCPTRAPAISASGSVYEHCINLTHFVDEPFSTRFHAFLNGSETPTSILLENWPDFYYQECSGVALASTGEAYTRVGYGPESYTATETALYAIGADLTVKWQKRLSHAPAQPQTMFTPTLDTSGTIYIVENSTLMAYLPDGTLAWSLDTGQTCCNSVSILRDGQLVAGFKDGYLRAFGE